MVSISIYIASSGLESLMEKVCIQANTLPVNDLTNQVRTTHARGAFAYKTSSRPGICVLPERYWRRIFIPTKGWVMIWCTNSVARANVKHTAWANNPLFPPPFTGHPDKGLDPLIGQRESRGSIVSTTGIHQGGDQNDVRITTDNQGHEIVVHDFIIPRGGAYFFVPSMSTLEKIASAELAP